MNAHPSHAKKQVETWVGISRFQNRNGSRCFFGQPGLPSTLYRKKQKTNRFKDVVLRKMYSKFTGEPPCLSVVLIKLLWNFIEITLWHGCSPVNLLHIFRTSFPKNTFGWLLLKIILWIERQTNKTQKVPKPYI